MFTHQKKWGVAIFYLMKVIRLAEFCFDKDQFRQNMFRVNVSYCCAYQKWEALLHLKLSIDINVAAWWVLHNFQLISSILQKLADYWFQSGSKITTQYRFLQSTFDQFHFFWEILDTCRYRQSQNVTLIRQNFQSEGCLAWRNSTVFTDWE